MSRLHWLIAAACSSTFGTCLAQCPNDIASRYIEAGVEDLDRRIKADQNLTIEIVDHDYDSIQIGVNDDGAPHSIELARLVAKGGMKKQVTLRIGPRKSKAEVIIPEGQKWLTVRTFSKDKCRAEARLSVLGGDSRVAAVVVGISNYAHVRDLNYAENDATVFEAFLRNKVPNEELNLVTLLGSDATERAIRKAIYKATDEASKQGFVIVYFSGHGSILEDAGKIGAYLVPYDAEDAEIPISFIPHEKVLDWLGKSVAGRTFLIADACFSGVSLKEGSPAIADQTQNPKSLMKTDRPSLIAKLRVYQPTLDWAPPSMVWFSASEGGEVSYESVALKSGVFTHYLMLAVAEDITYLKALMRVRRQIEAEKASKQTPQLFGGADGFEMNFPVNLTGAR